MQYTRPSDWAYGAAAGAMSPALMLYWERVSPSFVGKGGFAPVMRLSGAIGVTGCFVFAYARSCSTSELMLYDEGFRIPEVYPMKERLLIPDRPFLRNPREPS
jgi:hypothetical protein